jgi:Ca2+-binding EF-hand superfamily protein
MATERSLRRAFALLDADGNGSLSADELLAILTRTTEDAALTRWS